MRKTGPVSKTTYYRRLRQARELGCSVEALPDRRGKHGKQPRSSSHPRWNSNRLMSPDGYVLLRVGRTHPMADSNGYCREHDLVMAAAIGRPLAPGEVVHHKNGDKTDNRLENLELTTIRGHNASHHRVKLTAEQVREIRERYASGLISQGSLAEEYGVQIQTISKIIRGRRWTDVGGPVMTVDMRAKDIYNGRFAHPGRLLDGREWNEVPK